MNKLNLPEIARESFLQYKIDGTISNKRAADILQVLSLMIKERYRIFNEFADDFVHEAFINLYNSFKNNGVNFWDTIIENTTENDKRIIGYIYRIISSAYKETDYSIDKKESINLKNQLKSLLSELVENGFLTKNNDYFHLTTQTNFTRCNVEVGSQFISIRNKNGTINKEKLKDLIINLFSTDLEKCELVFSNILEIITSITDFGSSKMVSISEEINNDEKTTNYELFISNDDLFNEPEAVAEAESLIEKWYENLQHIYSEEELQQRCTLFVLKYGYKLTLTEISNHVSYKVSKSTVDNYIKEFIRVINISYDLDINDKRLSFYIDAFILYLIDKFNISEK